MCSVALLTISHFSFLSFFFFLLFFLAWPTLCVFMMAFDHVCACYAGACHCFSVNFLLTITSQLSGRVRRFFWR